MNRWRTIPGAKIGLAACASSEPVQSDLSQTAPPADGMVYPAETADCCTNGIAAFALHTDWLALRQRLLDTCDVADLFDKKVDQQPDPGNACAFGDDQHVQKNGRQRVFRQYLLKLTGRQEIADKPLVSGRDAAPGNKGFPRRKPMIDAKSTSEGDRVAFAARSLQGECVASRYVRHTDALMAEQVFRNSRPSPRRKIIPRRYKQTPALAEGTQLHGAVSKGAQAKRDVDALAYKVDALVGETEVNPDVGIAVLKGEDEPADVQDAESRRAGHPDGAGRRAARAPSLITGLLHKAQDLDTVGIIAAALIGHRDTPGGPAEQRYADGRLELAQMPRDRRLTDPELACDCRQVSALGDTDKGSNTLERYVRPIHYLA